VQSHVFNHGVVTRDFCQSRNKKIQPQQDSSYSDGGSFHKPLPESQLGFSCVSQPGPSVTWLRTVSKLLTCKFDRRTVRLIAAKVCAGLSGLKAIQFLCDWQQPRSQCGSYQQLERNHNGGRKAPYEIKKAVPEP